MDKEELIKLLTAFPGYSLPRVTLNLEGRTAIIAEIVEVKEGEFGLEVVITPTGIGHRNRQHKGAKSQGQEQPS